MKLKKTLQIIPIVPLDAHKSQSYTDSSRRELWREGGKVGIREGGKEGRRTDGRIDGRTDKLYPFMIFLLKIIN